MNSCSKVVTESVLKDFNITSRITEAKLLEDVTSAISEAYTLGCVASGMNNVLLQESLNYFWEKQNKTK